MIVQNLFQSDTISKTFVEKRKSTNIYGSSFSSRAKYSFALALIYAPLRIHQIQRPVRFKFNKSAIS
jgi:hypothetical protein